MKIFLIFLLVIILVFIGLIIAESKGHWPDDG